MVDERMETRRRGLWATVLRHPRRLGFVLFNIVMLVVLSVWAVSSDRSPAQAPELLSIPGLVAENVVVFLLLLLWAAMWLYWGVFVLLRHIRR